MSYKEFSYFYDYFNYNADYDTLFKNIGIDTLNSTIEGFLGE